VGRREKDRQDAIETNGGGGADRRRPPNQARSNNVNPDVLWWIEEVRKNPTEWLVRRMLIDNYIDHYGCSLREAVGACRSVWVMAIDGLNVRHCAALFTENRHQGIRVDWIMQMALAVDGNFPQRLLIVPGDVIPRSETNPALWMSSLTEPNSPYMPVRLVLEGSIDRAPEVYVVAGCEWVKRRASQLGLGLLPSISIEEDDYAEGEESPDALPSGPTDGHEGESDPEEGATPEHE
jgi:hypothetical protein